MFDLHFLTALLTIFVINIVLSGDNAVVIALASRKLPSSQQKMAIWWGTVGAVGLRIVLTFIAAWLLKIPFLQFLGGLLLIWIAFKLLNDDHNEGENVVAASTFGKAIQTVIVADLVMSLDNVLAIAGAAGGNIWLIVLGLALSVPLIIWGSTLLMQIMQRFPIIIWAGAGVLGWTAGEMINDDDFLKQYVHPVLGSFEWIIPAVITAGILALSFFMEKRKKQKETGQEEKTREDIHASEKAKNVEG